MRLPYRKPGKFASEKQDPMLTPEKFNEITRDLENLKKRQPQLAAEVARLGELGDFSENAEYQLAKGRLRGVNNAILRLQYQLNRAVIIDVPAQNSVAELGHTVTIESDGQERSYLILGSSETDPENGIISHNSPIGSALLGCKIGDIIAIKLAKNNVEYRIVKIE